MAQHNYNQQPLDPPEGTEAVCAQPFYDGKFINPDWWFESTHQGGGRDAVDLCHQCPLILKCAAYALEANEEHGIWGGLTPEDRKRLQKRNSRTRKVIN